MDIKLPGASGFSLCTQIRTFSDVPIIFVTSCNTDMDELNSIMLGGDAFITKPYNTAILLAKIASLLKRAYPAQQNEQLTYGGAILHLESIQTALDIALTEDDLAGIREELVNTGYIKRRFTKKKVKIKNTPLHYISSDGYHIYVGKNNLQNDELTFDFAAGNDWWFHAKQAPGSHVIVKTKTGEIPDRTFEEAGRLAAYYSKGRGSEKVEVDYLQKKNVKKPNQSKPGFVVYYTNYSLTIEPDISGIELVEE